MMLHLTEQAARRLAIADVQKPQERRSSVSKYRNRRVRAYGRLWASQAELARYDDLLRMGQFKLIENLELQPRYPLFSVGRHCADYVADFAYDDVFANRRIVEDVKGFASPVYKLKRKLFEAQYSHLVFREVR